MYFTQTFNRFPAIQFAVTFSLWFHRQQLFEFSLLLIYFGEIEWLEQWHSELLNKFIWFFGFNVEFSFHNRKADIALIGLAVMGQNLILNMNDKGFVVCAYNRTVDKVRYRKKNREHSVIIANSFLRWLQRVYSTNFFFFRKLHFPSSL
jgi:NAD binding domain of 6-phosphogluconate dehydrogenase